jgi:hypothetical protein
MTACAWFIPEQCILSVLILLSPCKNLATTLVGPGCLKLSIAWQSGKVKVKVKVVLVDTMKACRGAEV